ncbi:MAG: hypothetical protein WDN48_17090 [Pseudolabrys sp.]
MANRSGRILQAYLSELTGYPEREYYRPNFFVTTPDILPIQLQTGEPWLFKARAALAATLSSNYGIYNGYELLEHEPIPARKNISIRKNTRLRTRDWDKPGNIKPYLQSLNTFRRENPALLQTAICVSFSERPQRHRFHQRIGRWN